MANEIKTERTFYASMGDNEVATTMFGPFDTAEEAESHTRRLGWRYVFVETRTMDEFGTLLDRKTRFYQPTEFEPMNYVGGRDNLDDLREKLVAGKQYAPLNTDEEKFFAEYETQMGTPTTYVCAECGEDIEPDDLHEVPQEHMDGTKETLRFHKSLTRCCPLKWANKRLIAAADKLDKIAKLYDAIRKEVRQ